MEAAVIIYQIPEWDRNFENAKSRTNDKCGFVCVPNKQHGLGLTLILNETDGAGIYGIWCLILGACSRQRRPRDGWLTDDGRAAGQPWTVDILALRWRRTTAEINRALDFLSSDRVGWLIKAEVTATAVFTAASSPAEVLGGGSGNPAVSPQYPSSPLNGMEGMEGMEGNKDCTEPQNAASVPADPEPDAEPVLHFPVCHRKHEPTRWALTRGHLDELSSTFPTLDVLAESRKALGWVVSNPNRKKTSRGMAKFLFGWLSRAQERGGVRLVNGPSVDEPDNGFVRAPITADVAELIGMDGGQEA
jgi:hypothetical protein